MTTHVRLGSTLFIPGPATKTTLCDNPGSSLNRLATTVKGRWESPISIDVCVCVSLSDSTLSIQCINFEAKGNYRVIYIYYIHPKLRIRDCRFRSGKGAGPLLREHRGSKGEHQWSRGEP